MSDTNPSARESSASANPIAQRVKLNTPILFRRPFARFEEKGALKNMSVTGAFLAHQGQPLKPQTWVELILNTGSITRRLKAQVIWTGPHGSGLKFETRYQKDRILVEDFLDQVKLIRQSRWENLEKIWNKVW